MKLNSKSLIALFLALMTLFLLSALLFLQNPQHALPNPMCLHGPGRWPEGSLDDQTLTDKLALTLMYGPDSNAMCTDSRANQDGPEGVPYFAHLTSTGSLRFEDRVVFVGPAAPSSRPPRFMAIAAQTCDVCSSMASSGRLFGAIFSYEANAWTMITATHFITEFGSWGQFRDLPDNKQLVQIGPNAYGILLRDTSETLGYTQKSMILIAEVGGRLQAVLDVQDIGGSGYCDNDTVPKCWSYDSDILFRESGNQDHYDLQITTHGTRSDPSQQIKDASSVRLFQFKNGHYIPITNH